MLRRNFLAALASAPLLSAKTGFDMSRIAVITDECAATPADAIAFAKKYNLKWLELRGVPGGKGHYARISEAEAKQAAQEFKDAGVKVSFLNTGFFKITLPGSEPRFNKPETPASREKRLARAKSEFDGRFEELETAIRNAHIYDVDMMRVFTFLRVEQPETVFQQTADIIGEMAHRASRKGIRLLVENENACNVVTCVEMASFIKLLPEKEVGLNWDCLNGFHAKETPFPDGYKLLPKKRLFNVQFKGKSLLEPDEKLPWKEILTALDKDGFRGKAGLETHYFDGTKIEKSHRSMEELQRIVAS